MENQRIQLSKTMLKNALLDLLQKEDIGRITVAKLCARKLRSTAQRSTGIMAACTTCWMILKTIFLRN